ncbi:MAG: pyridoxal-phosphate dependent enzyme [Planctomycetales bacterium]|nr:pyridoxal-phosphate dependent enzyme [Planctomycetales bacterium]
MSDLFPGPLGLAERLEGLRARYPRLALGRLPSPVEELPRLGRRSGAAALFVKRDDLVAPGFAGNKIRAVERLLGKPGAFRHGVLTAGPLGSHWVQALLHGAAAAGVPADLLLWQGAEDPGGRPALEAARPLARSWTEGGTARLAVAGARTLLRPEGPSFLMPGGASGPALLGGVEAALETADVVRRGAMPIPDVAYVPLGTGVTAAGLALGFALAGLATRVVAVRVTSLLLANRCVLGSLLGIGVGFLARAGAAPRRPQVPRIEAGFVGPGYGSPTPEAEEAAGLARCHEGLKLDTTYGAKALAALLTDGREGRLRGRTALFWMTLGQD